MSFFGVIVLSFVVLVSFVLLLLCTYVSLLSGVTWSAFVHALPFRVVGVHFALPGAQGTFPGPQVPHS